MTTAEQHSVRPRDSPRDRDGRVVEAGKRVVVASDRKGQLHWSWPVHLQLAARPTTAVFSLRMKVGFRKLIHLGSCQYVPLSLLLVSSRMWFCM